MCHSHNVYGRVGDSTIRVSSRVRDPRAHKLNIFLPVLWGPQPCWLPGQSGQWSRTPSGQQGHADTGPSAGHGEGTRKPLVLLSKSPPPGKCPRTPTTAAPTVRGLSGPTTNMLPVCSSPTSPPGFGVRLKQGQHATQCPFFSRPGEKSRFYFELRSCVTFFSSRVPTSAANCRCVGPHGLRKPLWRTLPSMASRDTCENHQQSNTHRRCAKGFPA